MTLEERRDGIGGSDAGDLMNEPPWGCRRRLWYEKTGVAPDVEDARRERLFTRGHRLEALIISEYAHATRRRVFTERDKQKKHRHPDVPYFWYHRDGVIPRKVYGHTSGILEAKSMSEFPFKRAKRDGLPAGYILQEQWALMCSDYAWGSYAILWPDGWEFLWWDVKRDRKLCKALAVAGHEFWGQVQSGETPEALEESDPRCRRCLWRHTCRGAIVEGLAHDVEYIDDAADLEVDESLYPVLADLREAEGILKEDEELVETIREDLRAKLGDREAVRCSTFRVYNRMSRPALVLIPEKLKKDYPRIAELCSIKKAGSKSLRVYDVDSEGRRS